MKIIDYLKENEDVFVNMIVYPVISRSMEGDYIMWNFNTMDGKKGLTFASYSREEVVNLAKEYLESEIGNINWLKKNKK